MLKIIKNVFAYMMILSTIKDTAALQRSISSNFLKCFFLGDQKIKLVFGLRYRAFEFTCG